jgi:hypothetical protein
VANPTYTIDPPAGGDHLSTAAPPKVYALGSPPADGTVVHAMEHGYVVLWYAPNLAAADVKVLRDVFDAYPRDVLVVPRPSLQGTDHPVVATAWHHRLLLPSAAKDPLLAFTKQLRNQGPEKIPH